MVSAVKTAFIYSQTFYVRCVHVLLRTQNKMYPE